MSRLGDRIAGWLGYAKRSNLSNPAQWFVDWATGGAESSTGVHVSHVNALKYAPFWAAVRIISGTLGMLPFKVYKRLPDEGGKIERGDHRVYALIHDAPNEYMDALTFKESRQAHVLCYGNAYAEIQRNGGGRPVALWPLLPDRTTRKITKDGMPYYEVRLKAGDTVTLPDDNVLHVKGLGFDGYTGYDVVTYHKEAIGYGIAVKEYGARFFGNGANPGGVLEHPTTLSDKAKAFLQKSWNDAHQGLSMSHRLQILEEGMKWHETGVDPQKAQALEVQKWTVDDCSRIFQIPPHKLGSMEFSKYNNVEQLNIDFVCTTMLYWFVKWEQEVNRKLFLPSEQGRWFAEIAADGLLRGNTADRAALYASGRQWGWLSINDIHRKENMNPIGPAGDSYLDPLNMVPAGTPPQAKLSPKEPVKEPAKDPEENAVRAAHRELLVSQWRRIITKQKNSGGQATQEFARMILLEPAAAYGSLRGIDKDLVSQRLDHVIERWLRPTTPVYPEDPTKMADDLMQEIGGNHHATS